MKIIEGMPWWFFLVKRKFPTIPMDKVGVTWGDCIYTNDPIAFAHPQKMAHERVHTEQQHHSKILGLIWWWAYCRREQFRFEEELEAYREEWQWVLANAKDPHQHFRYLDGMAKMLSSEHYGHLVGFEQAKKLIDGDQDPFEVGMAETFIESKP